MQYYNNNTKNFSLVSESQSMQAFKTRESGVEGENKWSFKTRHNKRQPWKLKDGGRAWPTSISLPFLPSSRKVKCLFTDLSLWENLIFLLKFYIQRENGFAQSLCHIETSVLTIGYFPNHQTIPKKVCTLLILGLVELLEYEWSLCLESLKIIQTFHYTQ